MQPGEGASSPAASQKFHGKSATGLPSSIVSRKPTISVLRNMIEKEAQPPEQRLERMAETG